jgi:predicted aconitase
VSYANSVIGARTNREGGPSALASAITGLTAEYGLHLDQNRKADVIVELDFNPEPYQYAVLGNHLGQTLTGMGKKVPYFRGIKPSDDDMKALRAAMAATGSIALYHVENTTPEWKEALDGSLETIKIGKTELNEHIKGMDMDCEPELIAIGCPHASEDELRRIADLVKGRRKRKDKELWVSVSRAVAERNPEAVRVIEDFGGLVLRDTCMVVSPIEVRFHSTAVNSGKAAYYLPKESFCRQCVRFRPLEELVMMAVVE